MTNRLRARIARSEAMFTAIRRTFLAQGYEKLTMGTLATACGLTRRALYHHFSSKEEAFRAQVQWQHLKEIDRAVAAASRVLAEGGSAIDAMVEAIDARYGQTQRELALSAMGAEYRDQVARRCGDIENETREAFEARLAGLLRNLEERHSLVLRQEEAPTKVVELLTQAIDGINARMASISADDLIVRYRHMCEAVLFGCAARAGSIAKPSSDARLALSANF